MSVDFPDKAPFLVFFIFFNKSRQNCKFSGEKKANSFALYNTNAFKIRPENQLNSLQQQRCNTLLLLMMRFKLCRPTEMV